MRRLSELTGLLTVALLATVVPSPARAAAPAATLYEAENATIFHGVVESNHAGFTGTGFVNYTNEVGSYVEWSVTVDAANPDLTLRFANGTTTSRPMEIRVDGAVVATPAFAGTGAWTNWTATTIATTLAVGTHTVRATATTANGGPNVDSLTVGDVPPQPGTDWSVKMVDSTLARHPSPSDMGGWSYPRGLYLYGQYLVYKRTGVARYRTYIKGWVDRFVDSNGNISNGFSNLDSMLAGRLLNIMYAEYGDERYRRAATQIVNRIYSSSNPYPRTSDGGFWHALSRDWQLWADGVFMVNPFLVEYGKTFGNATRYNDEAAKQLTVYFNRLKRSNGLLWHAYDEKKQQSWANPTTGTSPESWCRAIGWFGMATVQILDVIPASHPRRAELIAIVQHLARGYSTYQDSATGRWFQVVDKGSQSGNWTETSCSSMYTYMLDKGVANGYLDASFQAAADRGYAGVLRKISLGSDGRTNLTDISIGTNVGNYSYYIARDRQTNDFHGLGAFLIMNEQLRV